MNFNLYRSVQTVKGLGIKPEAFEMPDRSDAVTSRPVTPAVAPVQGSSKSAECVPDGGRAEPR